MRKYLIFAVCICSLLGFSGCAKTESIETGQGQEAVEGMELICLADEKEQAEDIADKYGIELVRFENGVASFHTDEDPQKVIDRGKEKGWPELSINGHNQLY